MEVARLLILVVLYIPLFHGFFSTAPLPLWVWGIVLAPWLIFAIEELRSGGWAGGRNGWQYSACVT